jgi:hypothetical protein
MLAAAGVLASPWTNQTFAKEPPTSAECRVAVLGHDKAAKDLSALVEVRLSDTKGVTLLERDEIDNLIGEQELQAVLSPQEIGKRRELGRLLKADLLVFFDSQTKPVPHVRVVVCETVQGLRLCNQPLIRSAKPEADAAVIVDLIDSARRRPRGRLAEIVAVPPMVNNSLTHEADELQGAFAQLIERDLLQRPNVVVVEFAEAQAVARELAIAQGGRVERPLPLYVLGDYRVEGIAENRRCQFVLKLLRGTAELDRRKRDGLSLDSAALELRRAAAEMFDRSLGRTSAAIDADIEARQLAERGRMFMKISNWPEAAMLFEASLLLKPDQPLVHRDAMLTYNSMTQEVLKVSGGCMIFNAMEHWDIWQDNEPFQKACSYRRAAMSHIEPFFLGAEVRHLEKFGCLKMGFLMPNSLVEQNSLQLDSRSKLHDPKIDETCRQLNEELLTRVRRILAAKATAKVRDDTLGLLVYYAELPCPTREVKSRSLWAERNLAASCEYRLKLLKHFAWLDFDDKQSANWNLQHFLLRDGDGVAMRTPAYQAFIAEAAKIPNAAIHRVVENCQRGIALVKHPVQNSPQVNDPTIASKSAIKEEPNPEVVFHRIPLRIVTPNGEQSPPGDPAPPHPASWIAASQGLDIVVCYEKVFLMREKGRLLTLPIQCARIPDQRHVGDKVCWDGQYLWALTQGGTSANPYSIVAMDPTKGQIHRLDGNDGLPPILGVVMAPLEPGKIFIVAATDRTWCATASISPGGRKTLDVFHEARETVSVDDRSPNSMRGPSVAFDPQYCYVFTSPASGDQPPRQRVLVGRYIRADGTINSALLIDPQKRSVEVLPRKPIITAALFYDKGNAYCGVPVESPTLRFAWKLHRIGFPQFEEEPTAIVAPQGPMLVHEGRLHVLSTYTSQWFTADTLTGELRLLRGRTPDFPYYHGKLLISHHYGIVALNGTGLYQVELRLH